MLKGKTEIGLKLIGYFKNLNSISFKPRCIVQCWKINGDKSLAMKLEKHIKKLSRVEKEKIIANPLLLSSDKRVEVITIAST